MNAKESELSIMIERSDGGKIDEKLAAEIRSKLSKQIEDAVRNLTSSRKLEFERNKLASEGFFVVKALTKDSRDWLLSCNLGSVRGIPLSVKLLNRAEVLVQLPHQGKTIPEDPMHLIVVQNDHNKELRMSEWNLINRQSGPESENLIIGVPKEVISKFPEKLDLTFLGTKVEVKVVKSTTLFTDSEGIDERDESEESEKNEDIEKTKESYKLNEKDKSKESQKPNKTEKPPGLDKPNESETLKEKDSNVPKNTKESEKHKDEEKLETPQKNEISKGSANESETAAKQENEKSIKANSDSDKETKGKKNTSCLGAILKKVRSRKKNNEEDVVIVQTASNNENLKK